ncbi:hypothetical protein E2320_020320 [Naja naja]|nr:hypothetical protein E2320_020320 [Naja naja]
MQPVGSRCVLSKSNKILLFSTYPGSQRKECISHQEMCATGRLFDYGMHRSPA